MVDKSMTPGDRGYFITVVWCFVLLLLMACGVVLYPVAYNSYLRFRLEHVLAQELGDRQGAGANIVSPNTFKDRSREAKELVMKLVERRAVSRDFVSILLFSEQYEKFVAGASLLMGLPDEDALTVASECLAADGRIQYKEMLLLEIASDGRACYSAIFPRYVCDANVGLRSAAMYGLSRTSPRDVVVHWIEKSLDSELRITFFGAKDMRVHSPLLNRSAALYYLCYDCDDEIEGLLASRLKRTLPDYIATDVLNVLMIRGSSSGLAFCRERLRHAPPLGLWTIAVRTVLVHGTVRDRRELVASITDMSAQQRSVLAAMIRAEDLRVEALDLCIAASQSSDLASSLAPSFKGEDFFRKVIESRFVYPERTIADVQSFIEWYKSELQRAKETGEDRPLRLPLQ